ncbi:MAG: putative membrane protein YfcA [Flavobacteriales bacterium]
MSDLLFYIVCGAGVGLAVGLTGVGGGSLMTPLLIMYGIPTKIAIGTDLLYAAITKSGAVLAHQKQKTIRWDLVALLAAGSIPASIATTLIFRMHVGDGFDYTTSLQKSLGVMLVLTSFVVFFKSRIKGDASVENTHNGWVRRYSKPITFITGLALGVVVTLSSVGAGAFCAALLLTLYPHLPAMRVVGTDIAHAVPLTLVAGMGHLWNDNIDWTLLAGLLIGSLPAVHFGAKAAVKMPNTVLQPILATLLLVIGLKFAFGMSD